MTSPISNYFSPFEQGMRELDEYLAGLPNDLQELETIPQPSDDSLDQSGWEFVQSCFKEMENEQVITPSPSSLESPPPKQQKRGRPSKSSPAKKMKSDIIDQKMNLPLFCQNLIKKNPPYEWNQEATAALIKSIEVFMKNVDFHLELNKWEWIAQNMRNSGFEVNAHQCEVKNVSLKKYNLLSPSKPYPGLLRRNVIEKPEIDPDQFALAIATTPYINLNQDLNDNKKQPKNLWLTVARKINQQKQHQKEHRIYKFYAQDCSTYWKNQSVEDKQKIIDKIKEIIETIPQLRNPVSYPERED